MSLINKMLQDLDARGTTRAEGAPPDIKPVAIEPRRAPLRLAAIAAAVLVLAGAGAAWYLWPRAAAPLEPESAPVAQVTPPAPAQVTVAEVAPMQPLPPVPEPEPVVAAAPPAQTKAAQPAKAAAPVSVKADAVAPAAEKAEIAEADARAAASTTSWLVASERARTEEARLAKRWKAEQARLALLPQAERRAGERKLREEQARAAAKAKREASWLAALKRKEAAGGFVAAGAPDAPRVDAVPAARGQGRVETTGQGAENAYRRALASLQDGRVADAIASLQQTLRVNPRHEAARQTLVSLLIENNRSDEAMTQLQQALTLDPRQPALAMLLARLQIERGKSGIEALQRTLPYAAGNGEYHAFLGGALQRQGRLRESAEQYETALRTAPGNAVWWMGLGIALQGEKRNAQASEAFRQAKALGTLSPELQAFVERRLQQLGR